jgi:hypothetical protein
VKWYKLSSFRMDRNDLEYDIAERLQSSGFSVMILIELGGNVWDNLT